MDIKTTTKNVLNALKDHVLSARSVKQMVHVNRSGPFTVNGRRTYAIIAALVIVIGLLIFSGGVGMVKMGSMAKERYEKTTGKFIRTTSSEDSANYEALKTLITLGAHLKTVSYFIIILGLLILIKPQILYYELKRLGFEKGIKAGTAETGRSGRR
jgi:hypothetical protein